MRIENSTVLQQQNVFVLHYRCTYVTRLFYHVRKQTHTQHFVLAQRQTFHILFAAMLDEPPYVLDCHDGTSSTNLPERGHVHVGHSRRASRRILTQSNCSMTLHSDSIFGLGGHAFGLADRTFTSPSPFVYPVLQPEGMTT